MYFYNKKYLRETRRNLRNNATREERILWEIIRNSALGFKFRRQHSIGSYIVDFCCPSKRLIIELDGESHIDNKEYDLERTHALELAHYKVIRFWNSNIINNLPKVIEEIKRNLNTPTP